MPQDWINGLLGGGLIGAAAGLLLLGNGRIAGVSGIVGGAVDAAARGLPEGRGARSALAENLLFVIGLIAAPVAYFALGAEKTIEVAASGPALIAAGLLVGFGARLGSGCTSGHGVCGGARLSPRSLVATATFMVTAAAVVAAGRLF